MPRHVLYWRRFPTALENRPARTRRGNRYGRDGALLYLDLGRRNSRPTSIRVPLKGVLTKRPYSDRKVEGPESANSLSNKFPHMVQILFDISPIAILIRRRHTGRYFPPTAQWSVLFFRKDGCIGPVILVVRSDQQFGHHFPSYSFAFLFPTALISDELRWTHPSSDSEITAESTATPLGRR